jgi:hypothetical protein
MFRVHVVIAGVMFGAAGCMLPAEGDLAMSEEELALDATEDSSLLPVYEEEDEVWSLWGDEALEMSEEVSALVPSRRDRNRDRDRDDRDWDRDRDRDRRHGYWECVAWDSKCRGRHCKEYYGKDKKKYEAEYEAMKKCDKRHRKCKVKCKWVHGHHR